MRAMQGGSLYHFYDGLWYDLAERRTHDPPCERRTRYRLSQPDTVNLLVPVHLPSTWLSTHPPPSTDVGTRIGPSAKNKQHKVQRMSWIYYWHLSGEIIQIKSLKKFYSNLVSIQYIDPYCLGFNIYKWMDHCEGHTDTTIMYSKQW